MSAKHIIQPLWEGYGSVERITSAEGTSVVIKRVTPPVDGKGIGHERKLQSYIVEASFYCSSLPALLMEAGATVAQPAPGYPPASSELIALTDLTSSHPIQKPKGGLTTEDIRATLRWAANLHAATWEGCGNELKDLLPSLWPTGTFFRLETRHDELEAMNAHGTGGAERQLARIARAVDLRLRGHHRPPLDQRADEGRLADGASGWALLHGDLKAPNLFFAPSKTSTPAPYSVAACDLQYCGPGCVMLDVAYFLLNSGREEQLAGGADRELVAYYVEELARARRQRRADPGDAYTFERAWLEFRLAVCDYTRFLAGWCVGRTRQPSPYAMACALELADEILCLANAEREACGATAGDEGETGRVLQALWQIFPAD